MPPDPNSQSNGLSVCFVVVGNERGIAGHFYSAHDLARAMADYGIRADVRVLALREGAHAKILRDLPGHALVPIHGNVLSSLKNLRHNLRSGRYSGVIAMDELGCRIVNLLFPFNSIKLIPLKPGWINTNSWISTCADFICFSKENADFYMRSKRYAATTFHYIPNRVIRAVADPRKISAIRDALGIPPAHKIIVAAGRIDVGAGGKPGKQSIFTSAINLFDSLNHAGDVHLLIMGKVANTSAAEWINTLLGDKTNTHLFSSEIATDKLSAVLALGDAVVAQGRTAMESMSLGLPTFVPIDGMPLPILITHDTLETLLYWNFSGRSDPSSFAGSTQADEWCRRIFTSPRDADGVRKATGRLFDEHLGIESALPLYENLLKKKSEPSFTLKSLFTWINSGLRFSAIVARSRFAPASSGKSGLRQDNAPPNPQHNL